MVRLAWYGRAFLQREQYLQNHRTLGARVCLGNDKQLSRAQEEGEWRAQWLGRGRTGPHETWELQAGVWALS